MAEIQVVHRSFGRRLSPVRQARRVLTVLRGIRQFTRYHGSIRRAGWVATVRTARILRREGLRGIAHRLRIQAQQQPPTSPLENQLTPAQSQKAIRQAARKPLVSVVVPVYRVDPKWLKLCAGSVVNQHYPNWELILVDDCSQRPDLTDAMAQLARQDGRIRLVTLERNLHISGATNAGIAVARGEFIAFLDHDDEITPDALTWFLAAHNRHPAARWFYSDEVVVDPQGQSRLGAFKPDYSPEYLLAGMYTCHLTIVATDLVRQVGGLRRGFEGAQDHDLALRLSEVVSRDEVVHIPRALYKWRAIETSCASGVDAKPYASRAGQRAVEEALQRRGLDGTVTASTPTSTAYRIVLRPKSCPPVTVIISAQNSLDDLRRCIDSLRKHTRYPDYEIAVIERGSDGPRRLDYLESQKRSGKLWSLRYDEPFNHSAKNNEAVRASRAEYVVFMNTDIELLSDTWLEQLVATVQIDPSIAGVGAKLLYPDGRVQHGGIVTGIHGAAGFAHRLFVDHHDGYMIRANALNEFTGVSAALSLVRRSSFMEVGGFDAESFPTSYNDIDLWLRLQQAGYRCLYNPAVRATNHVPVEPAISLEESECKVRLVKRWGDTLLNDRFYNPNLSLENEQFGGFRPFPVPDDLLRGGSEVRPPQLKPSWRSDASRHLGQEAA